MVIMQALMSPSGSVRTAMLYFTPMNPCIVRNALMPLEIALSSPIIKKNNYLEWWHSFTSMIHTITMSRRNRGGSIIFLKNTFLGIIWNLA